MGQYFFPISIDQKECVYSHDFGNGLKLMEHSYIGNNFVNVVEKLLAKGGKWFGNRIVWSGDYADPELDENGKPLTNVVNGETYEQNLYSLYSENTIKPDVTKLKYFRFLVNRTKKEYVDLSKVPVMDTYKWKDDNGKVRTTIYKIHPLPLLTCEGNGRGGGDYRGESELVGTWARDVIQPQTKRPKGGFTEIVFDLKED